MKKIYLLLILIILSFTTNVEAKEYSYIPKNKDMQICEYSDEYIEYLKLSKEEQALVNAPKICKSNESSIIVNNITSYSLNKNNELPEYYSSVENGYLTPIRDQKSTNSCWAFATYSHLESYMLKRFNVSYDLSERHLEYETSYFFMNDEVNEDSFYRKVGDGGNIFIASAYLTNEKGPIKESDFPFESNNAIIYLNSIKNKEKIIDVNDISIMEGTSCSTVSSSIKEHVMEYGAAHTSIYMTYSEYYYNPDTAAFFYNGGNISNHAVAIVGWDDNYSKENFSELNRPREDGAWIVRNSYGLDFGLNGYFYISYEDSIVCSVTGGVTDADTEFNDNLYSYDKLGYNASGGGQNSNTGYAANTFIKSNEEEILKEVTLGAPTYTEYEVYLIPNKVDSISLDLATKIAEGTITYGGYKTIKLEEEIVLSDIEFTIIAKYTNTEGYAIPLSIKDKSIYNTVDIEDNRGFVSLNGIDFYDSKTYFEDTIAIPSIKASTDYKNKQVEPEEPTNPDTPVDPVEPDKPEEPAEPDDKDEEDTDNKEIVIKINNSLNEYYYSDVTGGTYNLSITTENIEDYELLNIKITNNNEDVTNKFTINNKAVVSSKTDINIIAPANTVTSGIYNITINYKECSASTNFTLLKQNKVDYLRIQANTTYQNLINSKNTNNTRKITVLNKNNEIINSGIIANGYKLNIIDSSNIYDYIIIVNGDVSGDGYIKSNDALLIKRSLVGLINLNEIEQKAADVSNDLKVASNDALLIKRYLVGIITNIGG